MSHYIPYIRSDVRSNDVEAVVGWLKVNELLCKLEKLPPEKEFPILLEFLVAFAGGLEMAEHRMEEMLIEQAAISYKAYAEAVPISISWRYRPI